MKSKRLHAFCKGKIMLMATLAMIISLAASAQTLQRIPLPQSQNPKNADLPIAGAVWAGDTLFVSGWLDPALKDHRDTQSQTEGVIKDIQELLESQRLGLGDVVMMRVYLGADPAKAGKMDFDGMMAGYSRFFGTKDQPNKPARTTVQVVLPAGDRGALVEIDVVASRPKDASIVGTWTLAAADKLLPDGTRVSDYGSSPHGLAIFTANGYYSLQIYRTDRLKFASGDKFKGTFEEYQDVSLGMSTGFGRYTVDPVKHTVTFNTDRSSVPNRDDATAVRTYEINGDELSWKVTPRQDGSIPITVLRRLW